MIKYICDLCLKETNSVEYITAQDKELFDIDLNGICITCHKNILRVILDYVAEYRKRRNIN